GHRTLARAFRVLPERFLQTGLTRDGQAEKYRKSCGQLGLKPRHATEWWYRSMVARVFATDQGSRGALSMLLSASTLLLLHACSLNPQPTPPARGEQAGAPGSNTNSGEATAAGDTAEPANSSSTDGGDPDDSGMP